MSSNKKYFVPVAQGTPLSTVNGGKGSARISLSMEELALLDEIQRRGRGGSSTVSYFPLGLALYYYTVACYLV